MYISLDWIKDFIKIPVKTRPEKIAEKLTNHTVEVESFFNQSDAFKNVVVGRVLEVKPHPNADKLRLSVVDVKTEKLEIVCGAPNLAVDQMVAVALVGAILPNGAEIKEAEIRGEKSFGMICAEDELGIGDDHEGILVLDKTAKIGQDFSKYLGNKDVVLEVDNKSLSNRPDLLSHYGIARELGAILNSPLKPYSKLLDSKINFSKEAEKTLNVKVEDSNLCPRYMAVRISNLEVKESPNWLKERLIAVNQRPINNIVDITNYVMLETGQPLHAFDANKVDKIIVRRAKKDEKIETLDAKQRTLNDSNLVIADSKQAIAIAGLIGGANSEVDDSTTEIILESANFQAVSIRQTSQQLGLRTEASTRFEKSLDHHLTEQALMRFITLLKESCPQYVINSQLVDVNSVQEDKKKVEFSLSWLTNKLGQEIPKDQVIKILKGLGFEITNRDDDVLSVTIPSWRATKDVAIKEDLAEEILRLYGYDQIHAEMPKVSMSVPEANESRKIERKIKTILAFKYGLDESYNYSFVGEDQLTKLGVDFSSYLQLANPLSGIQSILRQTLAPNLINNIKTNQMKAEELGFFEIGGVYLDVPGNLKKDDLAEDTLPYQEKHLGLVLGSNSKDLFQKMKNIVNNLLQTVISYDTEVEFLPAESKPSWSEHNIAAKIVVQGQELGTIALVNEGVSKKLNLKKIIAVAEINFDDLVKLILQQPPFRFKDVPRYPPVIRDIAFVIDKEMLYNSLKKEILDFNPLIKSVELFDVYEGNKIADNKKSLAFHLYYQSDDKTLTTDEVDKIQNELVNHIVNTLEAQLRDF